MAKRLSINPEVLQFYVNHAEIPFELLQEKCPHINTFLRGEKLPTFNQLSEVAKKINVPTGLLLLPTPVEIGNKKLEFRTVGSVEIGKMSENLRDTIADMERKQNFLKEVIEDELSFLGSLSIEDNIENAANFLRKLLDLPIKWQSSVESEAFKFFRSKINSLGIFVFANGVVGQNNTRTLDTNEFRGFTLADRKAPLIFINSTDSDAGRLFTLVHELVHLLLGNDGIVNKIYLDSYSFSPVEAFVNQVTAEILLPQSELSLIQDRDISNLARLFKVSEYVVARRLLDFGELSINDYQQYVSDLNDGFEAKKSSQKKSTGGHYYNNINYRIDKTFFHTVRNAIYTDKITYTQAFDILGLSQKVFKRMEAQM